MSDANNKKMPGWARTGHAAPVTRRDFLAHGLIPFAATAAMPAWYRLLFGRAERVLAADSNCPSTDSAWIPFVTLNLAGGAAMGSNFVPMQADGSPLPSYSKMGLGNGQVPLEREFGNVPFAGTVNGTLISKMLQGIRSSAQRTTLDKTAFVAFCVRSRDDSAENRFDVSGLIAKAGVVGSRMSNMGVRSTPSGISQAPALFAPPAPLVVKNFKDVVNSIGFAASLGAQLNSDQKVRLAKFIRDLNSAHTRKLASASDGSQVQNLLDCAGIKNQDLVGQGSGAVDPVSHSQVASVWGLQANSNQASEDYIFGTLVYNSILGQAGSVSLERGGYDYHDNTRSTGDARDQAAGVTIGRVLETAAVLQKPVCLYVTTDGGVSSAESETDRAAPWTSDRGTTGISYLLMFDPKGRPATSGFQVGAFTDGQVADDASVIGNSPEVAAQAVFANYLQRNGKLSLLGDIVLQQALDSKALAQVVKVG